MAVTVTHAGTEIEAATATPLFHEQVPPQPRPPYAVSYLRRATFLKNKRAAGRPQDAADIDAIS